MFERPASGLEGLRGHLADLKMPKRAKRQPEAPAAAPDLRETPARPPETGRGIFAAARPGGIISQIVHFASETGRFGQPPSAAGSRR